MRGREKQRTKQRGQGWAPSVPQVVDVVARASERNADVVLVQHGANLPVVRGPANGGADAPEVLGGDLALGHGIELDRRFDPLLQDLRGTREIWVGEGRRTERNGQNTHTILSMYVGMDACVSLMIRLLFMMSGQVMRFWRRPSRSISLTCRAARTHGN
jgi:hypothetical protein